MKEQILIEHIEKRLKSINAEIELLVIDYEINYTDIHYQRILKIELETILEILKIK